MVTGWIGAKPSRIRAFFRFSGRIAANRACVCATLDRPVVTSHHRRWPSGIKEKSVNKRELAAELAERLDIDKKQANAFVEEFIITITDTVATGEDVVLTGFAKFRRVQRGPRLARNPQTGATVKVPAKKAAKITPLKAFKDAVIAGKKAPAKKKAVAKKAPAKKAPAKKKAVAKKAPARKTTARKAPARRR